MVARSPLLPVLLLAPLAGCTSFPVDTATPSDTGAGTVSDPGCPEGYAEPTTVGVLVPVASIGGLQRTVVFDPEFTVDGQKAACLRSDGRALRVLVREADDLFAIVELQAPSVGTFELNSSAEPAVLTLPDGTRMGVGTWQTGVFTADAVGPVVRMELTNATAVAAGYTVSLQVFVEMTR